MIRRINDLRSAPPLIAAVVLIVAFIAHAGFWYLLSQHLRLSGAIASALIALAVLKHIGWLGGAYALLSGRRPSSK